MTIQKRTNQLIVYINIYKNLSLFLSFLLFILNKEERAWECLTSLYLLVLLLLRLPLAKRNRPRRRKCLGFYVSDLELELERETTQCEEEEEEGREEKDEAVDFFGIPILHLNER